MSIGGARVPQSVSACQIDVRFARVGHVMVRHIAWFRDGHNTYDNLRCVNLDTSEEEESAAVAAGS